jgi:CheY-like chemotaxis protein
MNIKNALIIDDDQASLSRAQSTLASLGIQDIYLAHDGNDAAKKLANLPPLDLILCDIIMPERDGIEFISDLVAMGFQGGLVLMSANGSQFMDLTKLLAKRKNLQIWATLNKPLIASEVAAALESGLAGRPA